MWMRLSEGILRNDSSSVSFKHTSFFNIMSVISISQISLQVAHRCTLLIMLFDTHKKTTRSKRDLSYTDGRRFWAHEIE